MYGYVRLPADAARDVNLTVEAVRHVAGCVAPLPTDGWEKKHRFISGNGKSGPS